MKNVGENRNIEAEPWRRGYCFVQINVYRHIVVCGCGVQNCPPYIEMHCEAIEGGIKRTAEDD